MVHFRVHSHNIQLLFGVQMPRCLLPHSRFKFTRFNIAEAEGGSRRQGSDVHWAQCVINESSKCPSVGKWLAKLWSIHTMECCGAVLKCTSLIMSEVEHFSCVYCGAWVGRVALSAHILLCRLSAYIFCPNFYCVTFFLTYI